MMGLLINTVYCTFLYERISALNLINVLALKLDKCSFLWSFVNKVLQFTIL